MDSAESPKPRLTLYVRQGCHLCEQMEDELEVFRASHNLTIDRVDISGNETLESRYGLKIPVLTDGEKILNEYFLDAAIVSNHLSNS